MSRSCAQLAPAPTASHAAGNGHAAVCANAGPRARSSWSGLLRISLVAVPVKAYPAVGSSSASAFHLLHADCGQRIQYQKHCPQHGALEGDAIVRGYEYARDHYVVVEPQELEQLRPARDKALVLEQFVPVGDIDPAFFAGRSLYLLPDGPAAQHPYAVFTQALHDAGKGALGRVVLSSQKQLVLVRALGRLLALDVLHYPAQVRAPGAWEGDLVPCQANDTEQALARQLIDLASTPLDWASYRDTSAAELAALIEAKVAQQPLPAQADEPVAVLRLLDALQQSVAAARHGNGSAASAAKARKPRARRATA